MQRNFLNQDDLEQIKALGMTIDQIYEQINLFEHPAYFLTLERPCILGDGIQKLSTEEISSCMVAHEQAASEGRFQKFVPASGAASRMFKDLLWMTQQDPDTYKRDECPLLTHYQHLDIYTPCLCNEIRQFGFFPDLQHKLKAKGLEIDSLIQAKKCATIWTYLLTSQGLNYANLPKALLKFHNYPFGNRTAFEEHLVEAASYVKDRFGICRCNFTILPEHIELFQQLLQQVKPEYEKLFSCKFVINFSMQKPSTNTIAVDFNNQPLRDKHQRLVFRPGGHGALIENLRDLNGDLVYIKNIDNIVPERLQDVTITWKKVLGGLLVSLQSAIHGYLRILTNEASYQQHLANILDFAQQNLGFHIPEQVKKGTMTEQRDFLTRQLNRPIRICGVVKNEGEIGGGPFWVRGQDGSLSRQIVESAQVDEKASGQRDIWLRSTHFNPVDIVCGLRDYRGKNFDLHNYLDHQAVFISSKSQNGITLKALELPGLWNGAMYDWITILVEVPNVTFNPVKTLWDLLKPEHQGIRSQLSTSSNEKDNMELEIRKIDNLLVIRPLYERLDAYQSRYFKSNIIQLISQGEKSILLNLAEVQFLDSSGLGAILSVLKNLGNQGNLTLCRVQERVMDLFRLTRMNKVFQIFSTEKEALTSLGKAENNN